MKALSLRKAMTTTKTGHLSRGLCKTEAAKEVDRRPEPETIASAWAADVLVGTGT